MSLFSDILSKNNTSKTIDIQTVYHIYNVLLERYSIVESIQLFKGLTHDKQLILILNSLQDNFSKQINKMEKEAVKFKIKLPTRPPSDVKVTAQIKEVTDRFIYDRLLAELLKAILSLSRSARTTYINDNIRGKFQEFLLQLVTKFGVLHKYGESKGWDPVFPSYKTNNSEGNEPLTVSEAFHIWHHLSFRYQQLELTLVFQNYVQDADFKAGMAMGVDMLKDQIDKLEKLAIKYKVQLPDRPPASLKSRVEPETLEDRFMYQQIFIGIDAMLDHHYGAILEMFRNEEIMAFFVELLKNEIKIYDTMVKYGKFKGWLNQPPIYS